MFRESRSFYIAVFLMFCISFTGCLGGKRVPNLEAIFAAAKTQKGKRPVIIIPGIMGSELEDPRTKESAWLSFSNIKGDGLSLPISPNLAENRDTLVVKGILKSVKISRFLPEISIYKALINAMENYGGYKEGNWEDPNADGDGSRDKYYIFAYDWRLDNVANARLLTERVIKLKEKLNEPDLHFNVIAHSMGGLIIRYAAMYGDKDLPAGDEKAVPNWEGTRHFNKIFMFGTPNEGSMSALQVLIKGYTIQGFSINSLNTESVITSPAIFQLLPHQHTARFYDENLNPLKVDLYNPQTWKEYRWSAYTNSSFLDKFSGQANAVDKTGKKSIYADISLKDLDDYFAAVLNRARHFHEALDADTPVPASVSFFAFGSDCDQTLDGAIILKNAKTDQWQTIFSSRGFQNSKGNAFSREKVKEVLFSPGDMRVTRRSLLAESFSPEAYQNTPLKKSFLFAATLFCDSHEQLPNSRIVLNNFLTALISEAVQ